MSATGTQRSSRPRTDEAGFTLIEALFAIVILAVGLMAVANLLVVAASSNTVARHATATTTAASETLESLKGVTFTALVPGGDVNADVAGYTRDDTIAGVGPIHTRWRITAVDGQTLFIRVRSDSEGALARGRSRAEFTTFRTCTTPAGGCPNP